LQGYQSHDLYTLLLINTLVHCTLEKSLSSTKTDSKNRLRLQRDHSQFLQVHEEWPQAHSSTEQAPHLLLLRNLTNSACNLGAKLQVCNSSSPLQKKIILFLTG